MEDGVFGLRLGLGFGDGEPLGLLSGEKPVLWLCFRTAFVLERQRDEDIGLSTSARV